MTTYEQLAAAVEPHLEAYHDDLRRHDREWLEANPGVPFLHYTRRTGTDLVELAPIDRLPKAGERVPYLFGTADREHIVNMVRSLARYFARENDRLCHHFDGSKLRRIDGATALKLAEDYTRAMGREFDDERNGRRYDAHLDRSPYYA